MARRRQRRRAEKERRHASPPVPVPAARDLELTGRVKRLAYTSKQAAEALGVSLATLDRRVIPAIETVRTEWGSRLVPVVELERYLAERREQARAERRKPARRGRKPGLPSEVIARVRADYAKGVSLGESREDSTLTACQRRRAAAGGGRRRYGLFSSVRVRPRPLTPCLDGVASDAR